MRPAKKATAVILACGLCLISMLAAGNPASLARAEAQIDTLFTHLAVATTVTDKQILNDSIVSLMEVSLKIPGSMDYSFSRLTRMGKISSTDGMVRIYTWNLPHTDGTNTYYGFLQYKTSNNGEIKQVFLNDKSSGIQNPLQSILSPSEWYGMLIYEIVENKDGNNKYYTLLGLDNQDMFISCKIADVLYFDDRNEPLFGKPIFQYQNKLACRILFQYSAKVKMSLKWNTKMKMIVFDHLAPPNSSYTGNFAFYGPDLSYDGLRFENGKWVLLEKIDVRNSNE